MSTPRLIVSILVLSSVFVATQSFSDNTVSTPTFRSQNAAADEAGSLETQLEWSLGAPSSATSSSLGCFDVLYLDWTDSVQRLSDQIIRGLCGCLVDRMGAFPVYTRNYSNNVETLWGTVEILETRGESGVSYVMDSAHYYKDRGPCLGVFSESDDWGSEKHMTPTEREEYRDFKARLADCNKALAEWEQEPPDTQIGRDVLASGCTLPFTPVGEGTERLESLFAHLKAHCCAVDDQLVPEAGRAAIWLTGQNILNVGERLAEEQDDSDFEDRGRKCGSEDDDDDPCEPNPCGVGRECEPGDEGPGDYRCE